MIIGGLKLITYLLLMPLLIMFSGKQIWICLPFAWDSIIENVKNFIFQHERNIEVEHSSFFEVVKSILIDR